MNPELKTINYELRTFPKQGRLQGVVICQAATYGGMMTNFGRRIAEKVVAEGGELHFFCSSLPIYGNPPPVKEMEKIGGIYHGFKIPRLPSPFLDLIAIIRMAQELRKLRVQIFHTRSPLMMIIGGIAGRLAGVPIMVHHWDDLLYRLPRWKPVVRNFAGFVEKLVSRLFDRLIFVSSAVLQDAIKLGIPSEKCVFVGHDLNPDIHRAVVKNNKVEKMRHPLIDKLGIPEDALIVGSIGRFVPEKGFDLLLKIAKKICAEFPDCYFIIKGNGPLLSFLEAMISEYGLSEKVFLYTGQLPTEDMPILYKSFDVFVLPTRREGFGMVFAEAMAFGVPVIGPNIRPVNEVIGPNCGYLVEPENVDEYYNALRSLLKSPELRRKMGVKAREYALKTWGGESAADRVIQLYCELIESRRLKSRCSEIIRIKGIL